MDRHNGLDVPRTLEEACDPARTALLVYDMQVGILDQMGGVPDVVANVERVLAAARERAVRRLFVRHVTLPVALMGAAQLRMWRAWQGRDAAAEVVSPFPPGSPGAQVSPVLAPREDEAVLDKVTMSAFEGTPLDLVLRDCGVTTLVLVGVATEIGIDLTARHAADLGYVPVLVTDACGAGDPEAGERALATLAFAGDTLLCTTAELVATLG